jgi:hypothetical protein
MIELYCFRALVRFALGHCNKRKQKYLTQMMLSQGNLTFLKAFSASSESADLIGELKKITVS